MRNFKNFKRYIFIILLFFIFKSSASVDDFTYRIFHGVNILKDICMITTNSRSSAFDVTRTNKKTWIDMGPDSSEKGIRFYCLMMVTFFQTGYLLIIIDIRKKIKEFNNIRFNGSKYKGGCLLPAA